MLPLGSEFELFFFLIVVVMGCLAGLLAGLLLDRLLRRGRSRVTPDLLLGGVGFALAQFLMDQAERHSQYDKARVIGWRGIFLNHQLTWAVALVVVLVAGRRFLSRSGGASNVDAG